LSISISLTQRDVFDHVYRRKMGHPANQQHLIHFVSLLKGSAFGNAHFPRDLMQASHFPCTAAAPSVEALSTNAAKVSPSYRLATTEAQAPRSLFTLIILIPPPVFAM
jgi:hypothetical protein